MADSVLFVPSSTKSLLNLTVTGADTAHEALADSSDSSYLKADSNLSQYWAGVFPTNTVSLGPGGASFVFRCKYGSDSYKAFSVRLQDQNENYDALTYSITSTSSIADYTWTLSEAEEESLLEMIAGGWGNYIVCRLTFPRYGYGYKASLYATLKSGSGIEMGCVF